MNYNSVLEIVRAIVADHHSLPIERIAETTRFTEDLDESLDFVEIVVRCEETFGCRFNDDDFRNVGTVGELAALIAGPPDDAWPPAPSQRSP